MTWKLDRTEQCAKCPWLIDTDPEEIPNRYSIEKHQALARTIAIPGDISEIGSPLRIMACHETHKSHCIGWLHKQLGDGNNIHLRMRMATCSNGRELKLIGEQHQNFEDTIPNRGNHDNQHSKGTTKNSN